MKFLMVLIALTISTSAMADYESASKAAYEAERAKAEQEFAKKIPGLNKWIIRTLNQYGKKLGGIVGPIQTQPEEDGLIKGAQFSTKRGYECSMMVGIVLISGRFNMIVQCASPQEANHTGQVFRHGTGGW